MFLGAVVGALSIVHGQIVVPLAVALVMAAGVGGVTRVLGASNPAWSQAER
jgi:hypothetical protein